jgi:hypothetical protein
MQPVKFNERKKRLLTFAGLYTASVILMFFIFSASGVHFSQVNQKVNTVSNDLRPKTMDDLILRSDSLLHAELIQLLQSDDKYAMIIADPASSLQRSGAVAAIVENENIFKKLLDSLQQLANDYQGTDKAATYSTLTSSFKSIFNSRLTIRNIQASMASGETVLPDDHQDMLQLKSQLDKKDSTIARMQEQLRILQNKDFVPAKSAGSDEAQRGEIDLLKTAFNDQQKEYQAVLDKYNRLKNDNSYVVSQLAEYKKETSAQADNANATNENKINQLQQKVLDLNADLYFTKIDCNLSRADAQQIISNARQRKELLTETLVMLNRLSSSADAGIQKKAKEKIILLNHVATTLHD